MSDRRRSELGNEFHGGDLADAIRGCARAGDYKQDQNWLDLSTGINPHSYPLPVLPSDVWQRLPGRTEGDDLLAAAAACYGAPDAAHIVAASGSQTLLQTIPYCLPDHPVMLVGPTYNGHVYAWRAAGREVTHCAVLEECDPFGITVLVNPNNPDGRIISVKELGDFAAQCSKAGGWLIVDEAYCDLDPSLSLGMQSRTDNVVVLRSFGKFFGLAGLRLGFAIAPLELISRLRTVLGSWAVSGPAIAIAAQALRDAEWQEDQRKSLCASASRLDKILNQSGLIVIGGTALFRLARTNCVPRLFEHLLEHGIYVRRFEEHPEWLRFGLPGRHEDWMKLENTLISFKT